MENKMTVSMLMHALSTLAPDAPIYLESADGNTIAWSGQITMSGEQELNVTAQSNRPAAKLHIVG